MPILTLEEMVSKPREAGVFAEDKRKPVICVLDPIELHRPSLEYWLTEISERIDFFWHSQFSRASIEMGGIDGKTGPSSIAFKRPFLIISELEVFPDEGYYGLTILGNIRRSTLLKNIPLIVISSEKWIKKIRKESMEDPERLRADHGFIWSDLKVRWSFTWNGLTNYSSDQSEFFVAVSQLLGLKSGPKAAA